MELEAWYSAHTSLLQWSTSGLDRYHTEAVSNFYLATEGLKGSIRLEASLMSNDLAS